MKRHAYLILAHNEPEVLSRLVRALDDGRNDIFIHWDRKSGDAPDINTEHSALTFVEPRMNVHWGGLNMVKAEYLLFEQAHDSGPYAYYHLISGVDLPLKSQDFIHARCDAAPDVEYIAFAPATQEEIDFRTRYWHLFPENFKNSSIIVRGVRRGALELQKCIKVRRTGIEFCKGSQWCSVTEKFVEYLLERKDWVMKTFSHTFCPDEMFIPTLCWNSDFRSRVHCLTDEFEGCKRFIKWIDGELMPLEEADLPAMLDSGRWFARKFTKDNAWLK